MRHALLLAQEISFVAQFHKYFQFPLFQKYFLNAESSFTSRQDSGVISKITKDHASSHIATASVTKTLHWFQYDIPLQKNRRRPFKPMLSNRKLLKLNAWKIPLPQHKHVSRKQWKSGDNLVKHTGPTYRNTIASNEYLYLFCFRILTRNSWRCLNCKNIPCHPSQIIETYFLKS